MSHPGFLAKLLANLKGGDAQSPPKNVTTTAPMQTDGADSPNDRRNVNVPNRESVMLPDETESLLTDTLGIAETSDPHYSRLKRPSGKFPGFHFLFV